jgi:hypothetical protein
LRIRLVSPCKDTGFNTTTIESLDVRGMPRVYNTTVDRGCYEWNPGDPN